MRNKKRKALWGTAAVLTACIASVVTCNVMVLQAAKGKMYDRVEDVPYRRVALLLGTSPIGRNGRPNQFFLRRIDATVKLWKARKFDRLFISGGNFERGYNEPEEMKAKLVQKGLPPGIITLDGNGFRTIHSMENAKRMVGSGPYLIISQRFHNERALYLAKKTGLDAIAFNADNTSSKRWRIQMRIREALARVKAVFE